MEQVPGYWSGINKVQRLLQRVIGADPDLTSGVAIAGSSALYWYQHRYNIGPIWDEEPHDIDVFVCGNNGQNFDAIMIHVEEELQYNATSHGLKLKSQIYSENTYAHPSKIVKIQDYFLRDTNDDPFHGRSFVLSFVQSPYETIEQTISSFDFDICRVVYNIRRNDFTVSPALEECIRSGTATITHAFMMFENPGHPTNREIAKIQSTLHRLAKYNRRGFTFSNASGIMILPF